MADVVSALKRSEMMAGIRGKDTSPELFVRRALHALGYRYRLHDRRLPGRPDLVFASLKSVIEIQGCFWHAHDCHLFKWPSTRRDFWKAKIEANRERDIRNQKTLVESGWSVLLVWECALKGTGKLSPEALVAGITNWLEIAPLGVQELAGKEHGTG